VFVGHGIQRFDFPVTTKPVSSSNLQKSYNTWLFLLSLQGAMRGAVLRHMGQSVVKRGSVEGRVFVSVILTLLDFAEPHSLE
jgi:hypothetical protein